MLSGHQKGWSPMCQSVNNTENLSLKHVEMLIGVSGEMCFTCVWERAVQLLWEPSQGSFPRRTGGQQHFLPHFHFLRPAGLLSRHYQNNSHCINPLRRGYLHPSFVISAVHTATQKALHGQWGEVIPLEAAFELSSSGRAFFSVTTAKHYIITITINIIIIIL